MALPAPDIRSNLGTWAVPGCRVPAVAAAMLGSYPAEPFDPKFQGQRLGTTYFDTQSFALRKARLKGQRYLVIRLRCYQPSDRYALSVKTENQKFRSPLASEAAEVLLQSRPPDFLPLLPADLQARLLELVGDDEVMPVVSVGCTRYAVENGQDRFTLDVDVAADTGRCLPAGVLEFKSTRKNASPPDELLALNLRPIKLSKFLWATDWR
jgi:hypothetical protein